MNIQKNKWINYIAIGVNPYKDWYKIYNELVKCDKVWDGDIGEWDASLSSEIQDTINEVVLSKFRGSDKEKEILEFFLEMSVRSWVLMEKEVYYKTHGILSGMWITNLFNSIINRCYSAGMYARECYAQGKEPILMDFTHNLVDFVQGDDKLCGTKPDLQVKITARIMSDYYESLGMTFTDGRKKKITVDSMNMTEVTFLKRSFRFHKKLGMIVAPLDYKTLTNMVMWYDSKKDEIEVMEGKLSVYQREMYLHEDMYEEYQQYLVDMCAKRGVLLHELTENYIQTIYKDYPDYFYEQTKKILGKNF